VTFAATAAPNSPEVALMQKYPVARMVNTKVAATAGSLWAILFLTRRISRHAPVELKCYGL